MLFRSLDAALKLNGRFLGLTLRKGQAVIELPRGRELSGSRNIIDDATASTNYGATSVDIGAPGDDIKCTTLGDVYTSNFCTSFATAHVTGAGALVWGHPAYRNKSAREVRQLILDHSYSVATLSGRCVTEGRLNLDFLGPPAQAPPAPPVPLL